MIAELKNRAENVYFSCVDARKFLDAGNVFGCNAELFVLMRELRTLIKILDQLKVSHRSSGVQKSSLDLTNIAHVIVVLEDMFGQYRSSPNENLARSVSEGLVKMQTWSVVLLNGLVRDKRCSTWKKVRDHWRDDTSKKMNKSSSRLKGLEASVS